MLSILKNNNVLHEVWFAGYLKKKNLSKKFSETVSVAEICETIQKNFQKSNQSEEIELKEQKLHFKIKSNLCFGAIWIHLHNVNFLLQTTIKFLCFGSIVTPQKIVHSCATSYAELTSEIESLNKWANNEENKFKDKNLVKQLNRKSTSTNMKKVTITEIDNRTLELSVVDFENEFDFGIASSIELEQYNNICSDIFILPKTTSSPLKRKAVDYKDALLSKKLSEENGSIPNSRFESPFEFIDSVSNSNDNWLNYSLVLRQNKEICRHKKIITKQTNVTEIQCTFDIENKAIIVPTTCCKKTTPISKNKSLLKRKKLIVDKELQIDLNQQMKKAKLETSLDTHVAQKSNRVKQATEKLKAIKFFKSFKSFNFGENFKINKCGTLSMEYMQILNSIFNMPVNNEIATEIWPDWDKTINENFEKSKFFNNKHLNDRIVDLNSKYIYNEVVDQSIYPENKFENTDVNIDTEKNEIFQNNKIYENQIGKNEKKSMEQTKYWNCNGILLQFFKIWNTSKIQEIDANKFCAQAGNRKCASMAFSSLLSLVAKKLLILTHSENSIYMNTIKPSEHLIHLLDSVSSENEWQAKYRELIVNLQIYKNCKNPFLKQKKKDFFLQ